MKYPCENCKLRAAYDKNPKSLVGRFWRWSNPIQASDSLTNPIGNHNIVIPGHIGSLLEELLKSK